MSAEAAKDVMDFGCRNVVNGKTLYIVLIVNGRLNQIFWLIGEDLDKKEDNWKSKNTTPIILGLKGVVSVPD